MAKYKRLMIAPEQYIDAPKPDEFANMLIAGLHRAGMRGDIRYDADEFCLRNEGWAPLKLANAYREYCTATSENRTKVLQHWVRAWLRSKQQMPEDFEDARHDFLPAVRARAFYASANLWAVVEGNDPPDWPYQPIGEHLAVGLVYDMPESMKMIWQKDLDKWGVKFDEVMEIAMNNLRQLPQEFDNPEQGVYVTVNHDDYDVSRLLFLDVIRQLRVNGDPIAVAPTRNTLIVTGSDDVDGLKCMWDKVQDALQKEARHVSTVALRLEGNEWRPWLPEPEHPLFNKFKLMQIDSFAGDYEVQRGLLNKLCDIRGRGFVASYNVLQDVQTGRVRTYSAWTSGITSSWLPRTDMITFGILDEERRTCDCRAYDWDRVVQVAGHLMEPFDIYPPWYEVTEFPTDEQFAAMGESIVPRRTVDLPQG